MIKDKEVNKEELFKQLTRNYSIDDVQNHNFNIHVIKILKEAGITIKEN